LAERSQQVSSAFAEKAYALVPLQNGNSHRLGDPAQARGLSRQNGLAFAQRELGKLERIFFTLQWLQDSDLRRRNHVGLNKGSLTGS